MDKHQHAVIIAPQGTAQQQVDARLAAATTVLAAAETQIPMALLQHQHAVIIAPRETAQQLADARLAAELTAQAAVVKPIAK